MSHGNKSPRSSLLFCILFVILCALPCAAMPLTHAAAAGNETLSAKPALVYANGALNPNYLPELSDYLADHTAFRAELITARAHAAAALFGESSSDQVILGKDGWLFYARELPDYEGSQPMSDRRIWCAAHSLCLMQEYAASRGASFLFAAAPNKSTIYPQQMPDRYLKSELPGNLDRLYKELTRQGVSYADVRPALREAQAQTYFAWDSHWNGYGSALAHDAMMRALGRDASTAQETFAPAAHSGDLQGMLYPADTRTEQAAALARSRSFAYSGTVRGADDLTICTQSAAGEGSLVMFRDSFGNALHEDMAESYAAALFSRLMPYDLTLLDGQNADTLVIELVERNLVRLAQDAPLMPAPVRTLGAVPASADGTASLRATQDSAVAGCVRYDGSVLCEKMDGNSEIFLMLDGTVYEAAPVGEMENSFTLWAPAAADAAVLVRCGGVWCAVKTELVP